MGIPGGSAAMRRPKRVPLPHFQTELGACHACHHSPYHLSRDALGPRAGDPCRPRAARPQAARREGQEPPRRDAPRRARRPHAGRHRPQPQRPARRLRVAAVARPERPAGAPRRRAARQPAADAIELRAGRNRFVGTVRDVAGAVSPPNDRRRSELRLLWPILPSANVRNGGFPSRPPDAAPAAPRRAHSFCQLLPQRDRLPESHSPRAIVLH